jgi:hypothetical protein
LRSIAPAGAERDSKSSPMRGSPQVLAVRVLRQLKECRGYPSDGDVR